MQRCAFESMEDALDLATVAHVLTSRPQSMRELVIDSLENMLGTLRSAGELHRTHGTIWSLDVIATDARLSHDVKWFSEALVEWSHITIDFYARNNAEEFMGSEIGASIATVAIPLSNLGDGRGF